MRFRSVCVTRAQSVVRESVAFCCSVAFCWGRSDATPRLRSGRGSAEKCVQRKKSGCKLPPVCLFVSPPSQFPPIFSTSRRCSSARGRKGALPCDFLAASRPQGLSLGSSRLSRAHELGRRIMHARLAPLTSAHKLRLQRLSQEQDFAQFRSSLPNFAKFCSTSGRNLEAVARRKQRSAQWKRPANWELPFGWILAGK